MSPPDVAGRFPRVEVPGAPWPVYAGGEGPPLLLLHELAGFTDPFLRCAARFADAGFSVWLPLLAGPAPADTPARRALASVRVCVSREIHLFARARTSPVVEPLRALAAHAVDVTGARGAGVVGMCFTGGFALALAARKPVLAAVASQPSLPVAFLPFTRDRAGDLGLSPGDEARLLGRLANGETGLYATRFADDTVCPPARGRAIERRLGVAVDDVPTAGLAKPTHSVLAYSGKAEAAARERLDATVAAVVAFLHERLDPRG
jgi:dienelactone hydrolase